MTEPDQRLLQDSLVRAAARRGGALALGSGTQQCTFDQLLDRSLRLARGLQNLGLQRGERVALVLPNGISCAVGIYGTLLAGGVFVVVGHDTKADRLAGILSHSGASFVIGDASSAATLGQATSQAGCVRATLVDGSADSPGEATLLLEDVVASSPPEPALARTIPLDLASLIYTSGTTGEPKGVMMTHENLVYLAGSISEYLRMGEGDRTLSVLSLGHTYGLSQLLIAVRLGAALHLERSFVYLAQAAKVIESEAITTFPGVPTVFAMLLSIHRKSPLCFESVERITCAGGALLPSFLQGLHEVFPNALVYPMYGLTECMRVCYLEPELLEDKPSSVGRAIPGSEVSILDSDGHPVLPGEAGTLHVRGPHVMPGYWNDPEQTARMLVPGPIPGEQILRTGDQFRMDEEGLLYFVGRSDEIIKTRGEKVSPVEVENALHGVEGVREAAVVGVPDELFGEAIRAYVALEPGADLTDREILAACRDKLEAFKVPKEIVFLDELPKTPNGKIRKTSLHTSATDLVRD